MQHLPLNMQNGNRTFHEMNLFQGNWRNPGLDRMPPVSESEMEKIFEEIDHDLGAENFRSENSIRSTSKGKSSGIPLILAPPPLNSIEEKSVATKKRFVVEDQYSDESSDLLESSELNDDNAFNQELHKSSEELLGEKMVQEDLDTLDQEESSESAWYNNKGPEDEPISDDRDEESSGDYESPISEHDLAPAAYRAIQHHMAFTKVRLPLHLANVDLEVDIFDTFNLARPVSSVSNVDCSLHSIDAEVLLPSANLFTKGTLLLTIDYVSTNDTGTMHSIKIHIPWKKIIPVKWMHKPELSWKDSKEYMFTSPNGMDAGFTREFSESLVEKVDFSLSSLHCVWNEQFINNERVLIQGTAKMQIDLFQKQCVDLERLLS
ncbi:hypothetical protein [Mesobacillus subterraneus]|uniref:hypothetical protein n=1 Tax=Mesobacillus subterraneus TaxID=285983 RepID=UPI00203AD2F8|nr:hypothetical protein [Mesobacillus subterraneus]MCM3682207.1 hypothetical protein [Mesobacillus subterraneus]